MARSISSALALSSAQLKLAFCVVFATLILHIIGFATKRWMYIHQNTLYANVETSQGIWGACACVHIWLSSTEMKTCTCGSMDLNTTSWLTSVQVLETLGLVALIVSLLCVFLQFATDSGKKIKEAAIAFAVGAGVTILSGIVVYAAWNSSLARHLHYSFGLCTVAAVGSFVSAALLISDCRSPARPNTDPTAQAQYPGGGMVLSPPPGYSQSPPAYGQAMSGSYLYHVT